MLDLLVNIDTVPLVLLIVFCCFFLIQITYYLLIFLRLARYKGARPGQSKTGVSVVICARNEYYNLKANLHIVLDQDYTEF